MNSKITLASMRFILLLAALFSPFAWVSHTRAAPTLTCASVSEIPAAECSALADLFASTNGAGWTNKSGWFTTATPSNWYGITVTDGHVTSIYMNFNHMAGSIPSSIGHFTYLLDLFLDGNDLAGVMPDELGNLTHLNWLSLADNQLTGGIPASFVNLHQLHMISIWGNQLTGPLPEELGTLSELEFLFLSNNQFSGSLPPELGNLSNLKSIKVGANHLDGQIPATFGRLANLTTFDASGNKLTGSIPPEIWNLPLLEYINLTENELTETLPPSIGNLSRLAELRLEANQLSGPIPPEIGNLSSLMRLHLGKNLFSGSIPPELGNLTNLRELNLKGNQLTGPIPPELGNLSNLTLLDLYDNQLSGSVPLEIGSLTALEHLNLGLNQLTGSIPPEIGKLTALKSLNLGVNQLTGIIPDELANLTQLLDPGVPGSYDGLNLSYNLLDVPDPYPSNPPTALQSFLMQKQPDWHLTQPVAASITAEGGQIVSRDGRTTITVPAGAVPAPTTLRFAPRPFPSRPFLPYDFIKPSFLLDALDGTGAVINGFAFAAPVTLDVTYAGNEAAALDEASLHINYWNTQSNTWVDAATTCSPASTYTRDMVNNKLSAGICHLSEFALMGEPQLKLFLPFIKR